MDQKTIKSIYGFEPQRNGEDPTVYTVGFAGITRIDPRTENFGTYGILWFDVYAGDILIASMNAIAVSEIIYVKPKMV